MPIWADANKYRMSVVGYLNGTDLQVNTFHFGIDVINPPGDGDVEDQIITWVDSMYGALDAIIVNNYVMDRIELYNITQDAPIAPLPAPTTLEFTSTAERLPSGVAGLVIFRTGVKRCVGRKFLPSFSEANLADGQWSPGTIVAMHTFGDNFMAGVSTADFVLTAGVYQQSSGLLHAITSRVARLEPAYLTRRRVGRGG